jgi:hypothetical protein
MGELCLLRRRSLASPHGRPGCARWRRVAGQGTAILAAFAAVSGFTWAAPATRAATAEQISWSRATQIRLPANAGADPDASLYGVACISGGTCLAGGAYQDTSANDQSMVVAEVHGRWGRARELRLPSDATAQPYSEVNSVACTSARSCVAVGYYQFSTLEDHGFIATESGGRWARARSSLLPSNADTSLGSGLQGVACTGPGSCVAIGSYTDKAHHVQPMAVTEVDGRWTRATELTMPANAAANPDTFLVGLACPSRGYCVATGSYNLSSGADEGLGLTESHGRWRRGTEVRSPSNANGQDANVDSVSCVTAWSCVAFGHYEIRPSQYGAVAVTESNGRWGRPRLIADLPPGAATGSSPAVDGIACSMGAPCVAVGGYGPPGGNFLAMAVAPSRGSWRDATRIRLPADAGGGALRKAFLYSVACWAAGHCFAVGYYQDRSAHLVPMAAASR